VLVRVAYLAVTNGLAMLRPLPRSDRAKDVEMLALRHQIMVLERQLHGQGHEVRFAPADRALVAALLHRLPRDVLHRVRLLVRPETALRWRRDLIAARHARISRPAAHGSIDPVAGAAPSAGEQHVGISAHSRRAARPGHHRCRVHCVGDSSRKPASTGTAPEQPDLGGVPTHPGRGDSRGRPLRTVMSTGKPMYVLAVVEHATRRLRRIGKG
jgi:putative transposase